MSTLSQIDLATVSAADFEPLVGSFFNAGDGIVLELLKITDYPHHGKEAAMRKPFGLVFKCDTDLLSQGTYRLEHSALSPIELFLSPFEGGTDWCKLEAIFN